MTATTKKAIKKPVTANKTILPPSADVITISGREYIIAPLDEFQEWEEDKWLSTLIAERIEDGGPYIALEEFEKRLNQKNKGQKK